jgi:hypothetical protein
MKNSYRRAVSFCLSIILLVAPVLAQQQQAQNSDTLRAQIKQLEDMDINGKPASVQAIHKRSLLKLYEQLQSTMQKDIADFKTILTAIGNSNAGDRQEIAAQIRKIDQEQRDVDIKIDALKRALQIVASSAPSLPSSVQATQASSGVNDKPVASTTGQPLYARASRRVTGSSASASVVNPPENKVNINDIETDRLPSVARSSMSPSATPTPIPQSLNDDLNNRISSVARANIEQRSSSNQTESPSASQNSSSLANQASAGDFVNVATNLAGLTATSKDSSEETNSVTVTTSAYLFLSTLYNVDPLNPYFYNKYEGWRRLSFTLGYDDEQVNGGTQTERAKLFGVKYLIVNKREPSRERNQADLAKVTNSLQQAAVRFGRLDEQITSHIFTSAAVREKIVVPQFRAFLTNKRSSAGLAAGDIQRIDRLLAALNGTAPGALFLFSPGDDGFPPNGLDATGLDPATWTEEEAEFYTVFRNTYTSLDYRNKLKADAGEAVLREIDAFIEEKLQDTKVFEDLDTIAQEAIENIRRAPQFSLYFLTKQRKTGADEYMGEAIYEYGLADRLNLTLNGTYNYINSSVIGGDKRQGKFTGQFRFQLTEDNLIGRRPVYLFFTGQGDVQSGRFPIYRAQGKLTIPVMDGIDLPLALTYSNRTETGEKDTVKGQFSFTVDTARLYKLFTSK